MKFFILNIRIFFLVLLVFSFQAKAEEIKKLPREHEVNFYSGLCLILVMMEKNLQ